MWEREAESAAVAEAVQDVTQGGGGVLLVEGPAGIGKTRLLAGVRAAAVEAGARVVSARGTQLERDFAFGLVRQLFEPVLADADAARREVLWGGPAAQARQVFAAVDSSTGPVGDFAVLHGLYWLTANAGQDRPLVLLVDDLQWCDAPSLRYLAYLLPRIEDLGVLVAVALRTGEEATDERLLQQITTDPAVTVLRPHLLSEHATTRLLEWALPGPVDPRFATACHQATGGNPLLLRELARTLTAEGTTASAENVALVRDLGSRAVSRLVAVRMAGVSGVERALARAAAILGDRADLTTVAALAGQDTATALESASALERLQILRAEQHGTTTAFIHPLVQAAVHDSIDHADRAAAHHKAVRLLTEAGTAPERIAAHILQTPPSGDSTTVRILRDAAVQALARGSPDTAHTYLHRCLEGPPPEDQLLDVLVQAGVSALMIRTDAAVEPLRKALALSVDPHRRTQLRLALGGALLYLLRPGGAFEVYRTGLQEAESEESRRWLAAAMLSVTIIEPNRPDLLAYADEVAQWPPSDGAGGRALDGVLAFIRTWQGDPAALTHARRAVSDDQLTTTVGGEAFSVGVWWTLLAADRDQVFAILDRAIARAHQHGSVRALATAYDYRGLGWLWRGQLSEAEADSGQAMRAIDAAGVSIGRPFNGYVRAEECIARGRLDEARNALEWAEEHDPTTDLGQWYLFSGAKARLLRLQHDYEQALRTALQAGRRFEAHGGLNPAMLPWHSEAALSLLALGRTEEARHHAEEEVASARRWGAPRALGRALRVAGLAEGGQRGLALLDEAVGVLEGSRARLEHAQALADHGAAVRRAGHRAVAREPLRRALDLATQCGATPVVEQARTELAAAGGRPRHPALTGPGALTPSEQRVAELAATGATNREIAQRLFVSPKTVEVHLSATYRKLGITTRTQLPAALTAP